LYGIAEPPKNYSGRREGALEPPTSGTSKLFVIQLPLLRTGILKSQESAYPAGTAIRGDIESTGIRVELATGHPCVDAGDDYVVDSKSAEGRGVTGEGGAGATKGGGDAVGVSEAAERVVNTVVVDCCTRITVLQID
jgi:hypothetical protein